MDDLHQSLVQAYRVAATEAIQSWAMTAPLEPMEEHDTEVTFVDRCVSALVNGKQDATAASSSSSSTLSPIPNWKLDNVEELATDEIRKRARAVYEKYHPTEEIGDADMAANVATEVVEMGVDVPTGDEDDDDGEEDDEESREGDGEIDEQGGAVGESASFATTDDAKHNSNGRNNNRNKRKRSYRGNRSQATRGGRRGGRGGGGNARSNN